MNWQNLVKCKVLFERAGINVPPPIIRALELIDVAAEHDIAPAGGLLDLTDEQTRDRVTDLSIRGHHGHAVSSRGMKAGIEDFKDQLGAEVREACLPYLEAVITELQPKFDEITAPLITAVQTYGFTLATTSDRVIDLADEQASKAWRDARTAFHGIGAIASLRREISTVFNVSPTMDETRDLFFSVDTIHEPDYSVCFAAGDNWSYDGKYYVEGKTAASLDWFALSVGGLHLNTPAEVREKQQAKAGHQ